MKEKRGGEREREGNKERTKKKKKEMWEVYHTFTIIHIF